MQELDVAYKQYKLMSELHDDSVYNRVPPANRVLCLGDEVEVDTVEVDMADRDVAADRAVDMKVVVGTV